MAKNEAAHVLRRIAKAERRIARGVDSRTEIRGSVSESAIAERLRRILEREAVMAKDDADFESLVQDDADEGRWFPWKGKAEFKVRRVPRQKLREFEIQSYGREHTFLPGGGTKFSREKVERYTERKAVYALLDSRNVKIPRVLLAGTELADSVEAAVHLDSKWSDAVKLAVFRETGLGTLIAKWTDEMSEIAAEEVAAAEEEKD